MSDPADPMQDMLRERRAILLRQIDDINVRIDEIDQWLNRYFAAKAQTT